jgi:phage terminase small subunit
MKLEKLSEASKATKKPLTPKQALFVKEYLIDLNGTQAAIRAGYSKKTAYSIAEELLRKPEIKEAVALAMAKREERTEINADWVLKQAVKLHERCMQEIEPFTDKKGNHIHSDDGRPLYVFNANGAAKALELAGKHIGVQAFKERIEHSGSIQLADRITKARGQA